MANLNEDQTAAAQRFFTFMCDSSKEFVIQGAAGTGKTHLIKHIINELPKHHKLMESMGLSPFTYKEIVFTATTHKAAQVLEKVMGTKTQTIHSLMSLKVHNDRKTGETYLVARKNAKPIKHSLIFIDEVSFIDQDLLDIIRLQTPYCKIVYIGDPFQLLPTSTSKCPVFDGTIPTAFLSQIMRNEGAIERLSGQYKKAVQSQDFPPLLVDNQLIEHVDGPTFQQMIDQTYTQDEYNPFNTRVLAWTNDRVHQYNDYIRGIKGYKDMLEVGEMVITNKPILDSSGLAIFTTDSTAQITSISEAEPRHGVTGKWVELDHECEIFVPTDKVALKQTLTELKRLKDWSTFYTIQESWGDLRPPYACTVHKSQGSTYQTVFIDLNDIGRCNVPTDVARMLYVAVSRASQKVVLYGQLPAKYGGIENVVAA